MRRCATLAAATLAVPALAAAQPTGPSPYLSVADSPFASLTLRYFHLETFEDGALNTPGVTASAGSVLGPGTSTDSVDADDGSIDGSGNAGHSWYPGAVTVAFDFRAGDLGVLPTHVGIVWTDVGNTTEGLGSGPVIVEAFDADQNRLAAIGPVVLGDGQVTGGTDEDRFFGVVAAAGIARLVVRMPTTLNDWEIDHLQYGAFCPADFTRDGAIDSDDFFEFLNAFFAGDPRADVDGDGTVDSDDYFDFINLFFSPC